MTATRSRIRPIHTLFFCALPIRTLPAILLSVAILALWAPPSASARAETVAGGTGTAETGTARTVTIFAAASLKNAMDDVAAGFHRATGHNVVVSLAGSSALARQIQHGAPADIFLSANQGWMDSLQQQGLLVPGTRRDLLGNRIVLIAHRRPDEARPEPTEIGPDTDLSGMLGTGRLAMALVDAVPAGIYGKAALTALGLWDAVRANVAQTDNVRAALALVASGEAPYGIVYATDARAEARSGNHVAVIGSFPADSHPAIVYPVAMIRHGGTAKADATLPARQFLDYLQTEAAEAAFRAQGFTIVRP